MKKVLVGLFILSVTVLFAQDNQNRDNQNRNNRNNLPPDIQRSFQKEYPHAQNARWNNTNGQWHGSYRDQHNRNVDTYYDRNGQRVDTHVPYDRNDLPSPVRENADRRYHTNYDSYRIERPNSQPLFQIILQTGGTQYMDENGKTRRYRDRH